MAKVRVRMVGARASVADVLRRAADIIVVRGWTRGTNEDEKGRVCARGALNLACVGRAEGFATLENLGRRELRLRAEQCADRETFRRSARGLVPFNDQVAKSSRQIISVLRAAAKACEEDGE